MLLLSHPIQKHMQVNLELSALIYKINIIFSHSSSFSFDLVLDKITFENYFILFAVNEWQLNGIEEYVQCCGSSQLRTK